MKKEGKAWEGRKEGNGNKGRRKERKRGEGSEMGKVGAEGGDGFWGDLSKMILFQIVSDVFKWFSNIISPNLSRNLSINVTNPNIPLSDTLDARFSYSVRQTLNPQTRRRPSLPRSASYTTSQGVRWKRRYAEKNEYHNQTEAP